MSKPLTKEQRNTLDICEPGYTEAEALKVALARLDFLERKAAMADVVIDILAARTEGSGQLAALKIYDKLKEYNEE